MAFSKLEILKGRSVDNGSYFSGKPFKYQLLMGTVFNQILCVHCEQSKQNPF